MMKTVLLATALGLFVFSGMALADTAKVDKALCQKLATDYATDPSSLTLKEIAQLQYCLAQPWAQFGEDLLTPARQLQPNRPGYDYGQLPVPSTPESLQGFDAWYQQQREQHRQQHTRYQQEARHLQPNPLGYDYGQLPVPSTAESLQGFDAWYQQQREQHRQQHTRYRQEARQHALNQMDRLRKYDRLRRGPLQPY